MTGAMYGIKIYVDEQLVGEIQNGETITLELPAGNRSAKVNGGGMSRNVTIPIVDLTMTRYQVYFSNWGFLGGGLNFKPA
jgi:hypothetical protein